MATATETKPQTFAELPRWTDIEQSPSYSTWDPKTRKETFDIWQQKFTKAAADDSDNISPERWAKFKEFRKQKGAELRGASGFAAATEEADNEAASATPDRLQLAARKREIETKARSTFGGTDLATLTPEDRDELQKLKSVLGASDDDDLDAVEEVANDDREFHVANGKFYASPSLALSKTRYRDAVKATNLTDEQKADAMMEGRRLREDVGAKLRGEIKAVDDAFADTNLFGVDWMPGIGGTDKFNQFERDYRQNVNPDATDADVMERWQEENGAWYSNLGTQVKLGALRTTSNLIGTYYGVKRLAGVDDEETAARAEAAGTLSQQISAGIEATGGATLAADATTMVLESLATAPAGLAGRGVVAGLRGVGTLAGRTAAAATAGRVGAGTLATAAALRAGGAAVAKIEARRLALAKTGGLAASSFAAGMQSAGGAFNQYFDEFLKDELSSIPEAERTPEVVEAARRRARDGARARAIVSGLATGAITAGFGATGAEKLAAPQVSKAAQAAKEGMAVFLGKSLGKDFISEFGEEGLDELTNGVIDKIALDPSKPVSEIVMDTLKAAAAGGLLGAGMSAPFATMGAYMARREAKKNPAVQDQLAAANNLDKAGAPAMAAAMREKANQQVSQAELDRQAAQAQADAEAALQGQPAYRQATEVARAVEDQLNALPANDPQREELQQRLDGLRAAISANPDTMVPMLEPEQAATTEGAADPFAPPGEAQADEEVPVATPAESPEAAPAPAPTQTAETATTGSVPLMVTRDMRQQLSDLGYTKAQINSMTPADAQNIIAGNVTASRAPAAATTPDPGPKNVLGKGAVVTSDVYRGEGDIIIAGDPVFEDGEWKYPATFTGSQRRGNLSDRFITAVKAAEAATPPAAQEAPATPPTAAAPPATPAPVAKLMRATSLGYSRALDLAKKYGGQDAALQAIQEGKEPELSDRLKQPTPTQPVAPSPAAPAPKPPTPKADDTKAKEPQASGVSPVQGQPAGRVAEEKVPARAASGTRQGQAAPGRKLTKAEAKAERARVTREAAELAARLSAGATPPAVKLSKRGKPAPAPAAPTQQEEAEARVTKLMLETGFIPSSSELNSAIKALTGLGPSNGSPEARALEARVRKAWTDAHPPEGGEPEGFFTGSKSGPRMKPLPDTKEAIDNAGGAVPFKTVNGERVGFFTNDPVLTAKQINSGLKVTVPADLRDKLAKGIEIDEATGQVTAAYDYSRGDTPVTGEGEWYALYKASPRRQARVEAMLKAGENVAKKTGKTMEQLLDDLRAATNVLVDAVSGKRPLAPAALAEMKEEKRQLIKQIMALQKERDPRVPFIGTDAYVSQHAPAEAPGEGALLTSYLRLDTRPDPASGMTYVQAVVRRTLEEQFPRLADSDLIETMENAVNNEALVKVRKVLMANPDADPATLLPKLPNFVTLVYKNVLRKFNDAARTHRALVTGSIDEELSTADQLTAGLAAEAASIDAEALAEQISTDEASVTPLTGDEVSELKDTLQEMNDGNPDPVSLGLLRANPLQARRALEAAEQGLQFKVGPDGNLLFEHGPPLSKEEVTALDGVLNGVVPPGSNDLAKHLASVPDVARFFLEMTTLGRAVMRSAKTPIGAPMFSEEDIRKKNLVEVFTVVHTGDTSAAGRIIDQAVKNIAATAGYTHLTHAEARAWLRRVLQSTARTTEVVGRAAPPTAASERRAQERVAELQTSVESGKALVDRIKAEMDRIETRQRVVRGRIDELRAQSKDSKLDKKTQEANRKELAKLNAELSSLNESRQMSDINLRDAVDSLEGVTRAYAAIRSKVAPPPAAVVAAAKTKVEADLKAAEARGAAKRRTMTSPAPTKAVKAGVLPPKVAAPDPVNTAEERSMFKSELAAIGLVDGADRVSLYDALKRMSLKASASSDYFKSLARVFHGKPSLLDGIDNVQIIEDPALSADVSVVGGNLVLNVAAMTPTLDGTPRAPEALLRGLVTHTVTSLTSPGIPLTTTQQAALAKLEELRLEAVAMEAKLRPEGLQPRFTDALKDTPSFMQAMLTSPEFASMLQSYETGVKVPKLKSAWGRFWLALGELLTGKPMSFGSGLHAGLMTAGDLMTKSPSPGKRFLDSIKAVLHNPEIAFPKSRTASAEEVNHQQAANEAVELADSPDTTDTVEARLTGDDSPAADPEEVAGLDAALLPDDAALGSAPATEPQGTSRVKRTPKVRKRKRTLKAAKPAAPAEEEIPVADPAEEEIPVAEPAEEEVPFAEPYVEAVTESGAKEPLDFGPFLRAARTKTGREVAMVDAGPGVPEQPLYVRNDRTDTTIYMNRGAMTELVGRLRTRGYSTAETTAYLNALLDREASTLAILQRFSNGELLATARDLSDDQRRRIIKRVYGLNPGDPGFMDYFQTGRSGYSQDVTADMLQLGADYYRMMRQVSETGYTSEDVLDMIAASPGTFARTVAFLKATARQFATWWRAYGDVGATRAILNIDEFLQAVTPTAAPAPAAPAPKPSKHEAAQVVANLQGKTIDEVLADAQRVARIREDMRRQVLDGETPETTQLSSTELEGFVKDTLGLAEGDGSSVAVALARIADLPGVNPATRAIAKELSKNPDIKKLSNLLFFVGGKTDSSGARPAGFYEAATHTIALNLPEISNEFAHDKKATLWSKTWVVEALVHEATHAATTLAIFRHEQGVSQPPKVEAAIRELSALHHAVKTQEGSDEFAYQLSNLDEFAAGVMSNPRFVEWLSKVPASVGAQVPGAKGPVSFIKRVLSHIYRIVFPDLEVDSVMEKSLARIFDIASYPHVVVKPSSKAFGGVGVFQSMKVLKGAGLLTEEELFQQERVIQYGEEGAAMADEVDAFLDEQDELDAAADEIAAYESKLGTGTYYAPPPMLPGKDTEYLRLVEGGDSGKDNLNTLIKSTPVEGRAAAIDQWSQRNPRATKALQSAVNKAAWAAGYRDKGWHASPSLFNEFDAARGMFGDQTFHFSPTGKDNAGYGKYNRKFFLKIKKPYTSSSTEYFQTVQAAELERLSNLGFDAILGDDPDMGGSGFRQEEIVIFSPEQIKSSDFITYDDAGNVIPPSQRFQPKSPDIRFAPSPMPPGKDAKYLELAKDPKKNRVALQRMVDAAAKAAGYARKLFHRTKAKTPFDVFETSSSEMGAHFGTKEQAADISKEGGKLPDREFYIKAENPFRMQDYGSFSPLIVADVMLKEGLVGDEFEQQVFDADKKTAHRLVQEKLIELGYDSIIYLNRNEGVKILEEDDGSDLLKAWDGAFLEKYPQARDSIIVFKPSQIKLADPVTRDESGNVIPLSQRFQPKSPNIRFAPSPLFRPGKVTGERKSTEALKNSLPAMPARVQDYLKESTYFSGVAKADLEIIDRLLGRSLAGATGAAEFSNLAYALDKGRLALTDPQRFLAKVVLLQAVNGRIFALQEAMVKAPTPGGLRMLADYEDVAKRIGRDVQDVASTSGTMLNAANIAREVLNPRVATAIYRDAATKNAEKSLPKDLDDVFSDLQKEADDVAAGVVKKSPLTKKIVEAMTRAAGGSPAEVQMMFDFMETMPVKLLQDLRDRGTGVPIPARMADWVANRIFSMVEGTVQAQVKRVAGAAGEPEQTFFEEYSNEVKRLIAMRVNAALAEVAPPNPALTPAQQEAADRAALDSAIRKMVASFDYAPSVERAFNQSKAKLLAHLEAKKGSTPEALKQYATAKAAIAAMQLDIVPMQMATDIVRRSFDMREQVYLSLSDQRASVTHLATMISNAAGLDAEQSRKVAEAFKTAYEAEANRRIQKTLTNYAQRRSMYEGRGGAERYSRSERFLRLARIGGLRKDEFYNAMATEFGLPTYDPAIAAELDREAERISAMPVGSVQRNDAIRDLNARIANETYRSLLDAYGAKALVKDRSMLWEYLAGVPVAMWKAGVLSGFGTSEVNFGFGTLQSIMDLGFNASAYAVKAGEPALAASNLLTLMRAVGWIADPLGRKEVWTEIKRAALTGRTRFASEQSENMLVLERDIPPLDAPVVKQLMSSTNNFYKLIGRIGAVVDATVSVPASLARQRLALQYALTKSGADRQKIKEVMRKSFSPDELQSREINAILDAERDQFRNSPRPDLAMESRRYQLLEQRRAEAYAELTSRMEAKDKEDFMEASRESARFANLGTTPTGVAGMIFDSVFGSIERKTKGLSSIIVSFPRAMGNLLDFSLAMSFPLLSFARAHNMSPSRWMLGEDSRYQRERVEFGSLKYGKLMSQGLVATVAQLAIGAAYWAGMDDEDEGRVPWFMVYGKGYPDAERNRQLRYRQPNWSPYTVKIGDLYLSWKDIPGFNLLLGGLASITDMRMVNSFKDPKKIKELEYLADASIAFIKAVTVKNSLQGLAQAGELLSDNDLSEAMTARNMGKLLTNFIGGATNPRLLRDVISMGRGLAGGGEYTLKDSRGFAAAALSMLPANEIYGAELGQQDMVNTMGTPVTNFWYAPATKRILPTTAGPTVDPIITPLVSAGLFLSPPKGSQMSFDTYEDGSDEIDTEGGLLNSFEPEVEVDAIKMFGEQMRDRMTPEFIKELTDLAAEGQAGRKAAQEMLNEQCTAARNYAKEVIQERIFNREIVPHWQAK